MAIDRRSGPGGPIRKTSWPRRSFCIIHLKWWTTDWAKESVTLKEIQKTHYLNLKSVRYLANHTFFYFILISRNKAKTQRCAALKLDS